MSRSERAGIAAYVEPFTLAIEQHVCFHQLPLNDRLFRQSSYTTQQRSGRSQPLRRGRRDSSSPLTVAIAFEESTGWKGYDDGGGQLETCSMMRSPGAKAEPATKPLLAGEDRAQMKHHQGTTRAPSFTATESMGKIRCLRCYHLIHFLRLVIMYSTPSMLVAFL